MNHVIENLSTTPRLVFGTAISFFGAIAGKAAEVQNTPTLQTYVWVASIFAATATALLAVLRGYLEWKKAKADKIV